MKKKFGRHMLILVYNIILTLALLVLGPILALKVYITPKYKGRMSKRLGSGLEDFKIPERKKRIWVHALSVGEVASALPLLQALKKRCPDIVIIFSSTTRGGEEFAESKKDLFDVFVSFPLDIWFVVARFVNHLRPDLFVLIETDFWPNFLYQLKRKNIPTILANGRIAHESFRRYARFKNFFRILFSSFSLVSMQTEQHALNMLRLGVPKEKIRSVGNLKYDNLSVPSMGSTELRGWSAKFNLPENGMVLVAGSTHPGEEAILLRVYKRLLEKYPDLFLVIAPRDVERGKEIVEMLPEFNLSGWRRTASPVQNGSVLILDTLGELAQIYALADIAFVGGAMVENGGHNPLEASVYGKPVIYGRYMTDFKEISRDLELAGASEVVNDEEQLFLRLNFLLGDAELRQKMGKNGLELVIKNRGTAKRYADLIAEMIGV